MKPLRDTDLAHANKKKVSHSTTFWLIFAVSSKPVTIVKIASNLSFEIELSLESTAMTQERIC